MIAIQYLQITSALHAAEFAPMLADEIARGRLPSALASAARLLDGDDKRSMARSLNIGGDLHLLSDMPEEAEDDYRKAHRLDVQNGFGHGWSCRAAGLQALFRQRLEIAANCFYKLHTSEQTLPLRLEAGLFAALIFRETGPLALAAQIIEGMVRDVAAAGGEWQALLRVLIREVATGVAIHDHAALADDIHWQVNADNALTLPDFQISTSVDDGSEIAQQIRQREQQLQLMQRLGAVRGGVTNEVVVSSINPQLGIGCRTVVILEFALAALAASDAPAAEMLMAMLKHAPVATPTAAATGVRRQYLYCLSKLKSLQAKPEESFSFYRSYASVAMRVMHDQDAIYRRFSAEVRTRYTPAADDISARLPPRHRRAYQYMLANLHRPDLSIAEVADVVGVTERALQLAFKEHVEITPREVLRRARMQKIHEALKQGEISVMEAARKYGVQNRTSLVAGYRKYFETTPSSGSVESF